MTDCQGCIDGECDVHVSCDEDCGALRDPVTLEEALAALKHWRTHENLAGCAHGC